MNKVTVAYVSTEDRFTEQGLQEWNALVKKNLPNVKYICFSKLQDLFPKLSNPLFCVDFIIIDVEFLQNFADSNPYAVISTLKTLSNSTLWRNLNMGGRTQKRSTKIVGAVSDTSSISLIKEMMPLVDGLCIRKSNKWTTEMSLECQRQMICENITIPKQIQNMLRKVKPNKKSDTIKLTPRQRQVFAMVSKSGASNKVIARSLNISESTVKLHVGAILKKYGLRNRTQLAVFVKDE